MTTTKITAKIAALPHAVRACVVAVAAGEPTVGRARDALAALDKKDRPGFNLTDGAREVRDLALDVQAARRMRAASHKNHFGRGSKPTSRPSPLAADRRALGTHLAKCIAARSLARSALRLKAAAQSCLKTGGAGGTQWSIKAGAPDYVVTVDEVRDVYKGSFKGYSAKRDCHAITLNPRWWLQVRSVGDGSGVVDGKLVLGARRVVTVPGAQAVHEVLLVRQGRGFTVIVEQAVLATWAPDVVTRHRSVNAALDARVPDVLIERDRKHQAEALRAQAERLRLEELDADAFDNMEI